MYGNEEYYKLSKERHSIFNEAGYGALRITLLFGSAVVALALIMIPAIEGLSNSYYLQSGLGVDHRTTGSAGSSREYTVRRSVLQNDPNSVCIIRGNGNRAGDC